MTTLELEAAILGGVIIGAVVGWIFGVADERRSHSMTHRCEEIE